MPRLLDKLDVSGCVVTADAMSFQKGIIDKIRDKGADFVIERYGLEDCVAADSIYANNANRKFFTNTGISTSFVRKGRAAKDEAVSVDRNSITRYQKSRHGTGKRNSCGVSSEYIQQMPY